MSSYKKFYLANPRPLSTLGGFGRRRHRVPMGGRRRRRYKNLHRVVRRAGRRAGGSLATWLANKAIQGVKYVRKLINVEFKHKDQDYNTLNGNLNPITNPHIVDIGTMQQGTTVSTRIGNMILAKSLKMSFTINHNASGANVQRARYLLVNYPLNEGTRPTIAELLNLALFEAPRNIDYIKQFRILASGIVTVDNTNFLTRTVRINRVLNHHIKYSANAGDYTDVVSGLITLFVFAEQTTNPPALNHFNTRFYFIDN